MVLFIVIALCSGLYAIANTNSLVIVYPTNNTTINANSTFFVGHTHPKATMTINGHPVKVYANGSFVKVCNLSKGKNTITLKSTINNDTKIETYTLVVPPKKSNKKVTPPVFKKLNETLIVEEDEAPLRIFPYGDRLTPTKKGVIFETTGFVNNHYKVKLSGNRYAYIGQSAVKTYQGAKYEKQILDEIYFTGKEKDIIVEIPIKQPIPVEITNIDNLLKVQLHGTQLDFKNYILKSPFISGFSFCGDTLWIKIMTDKLNGYDYYYDNKNLVLKIRKPFEATLYGKIIAIDPGHGGKEAGSTGPTEVPEKDINLAISKYLKEELEKNGATVIMTREDDSDVDLYERVKIAQDSDADILISIHNNALPDGQNPYEIHGTTTYYYNPQAVKLANIVQKNLVAQTKFKDLGIKKGSFVLTRPTKPVSLLVEVGYMIHPYEYAQLLSEKNQRAYAVGICNGLKEYLK